MSEIKSLPWIKAYVLFRSETSNLFLTFLKKDFRHCAVILESQHVFLYLDQTFFKLECRVVHKPFNLPDLFRKNGWKILETKPPQPQIENDFRLGWIDCVSLVKRTLGIRKKFIFTPAQLYFYLSRIRN